MRTNLDRGTCAFFGGVFNSGTVAGCSIMVHPVYTTGDKCKASCQADWDFYAKDAQIRLSKRILRMRRFCEHLGDPEMYNATTISSNKAFGGE